MKRAAKLAGVFAAAVWCLAAVPDAGAATMKVTADTPVSFRASFTGIDTDPSSAGGGNDFQVFVFDYWTVLVNLRGDAVDSTTGTLSGFYQINLTHSGSVVSDPTAPVVTTYLFYSGLQPNTTLTDVSVSSQPSGSGADYLSTAVNILFDPAAGTVAFSGTISGDTDTDGDGVMDSNQTDLVAQTLLSLRDVGLITGKEMGQIIKQTRQPIVK